MASRQLKASIDRMPEPINDTLVEVESPGHSENCDVHLSFEPTRRFYARHLLAKPPWLIKIAFQIAWHDLKSFVKHRKPRPIETVADAMERIDNGTRT